MRWWKKFIRKMNTSSTSTFQLTTLTWRASNTKEPAPYVPVRALVLLLQDVSRCHVCIKLLSNISRNQTAFFSWIYYILSLNQKKTSKPKFVAGPFLLVSFALLFGTVEFLDSSVPRGIGIFQPTHRGDEKFRTFCDWRWGTKKKTLGCFREYPFGN